MPNTRRPLPSLADDSYLPLKVLSVYSGMSIRRLRGYLTDTVRPLPFYRIGGKILVRRSEFDGWAAQFKVAKTAVTIDAVIDELLKEF